jgi:hypothetical protein
MKFLKSMAEAKSGIEAIFQGSPLIVHGIEEKDYPLPKWAANCFEYEEP